MKERKIGLDILKVLAMLGIVGLHIMNRGGLLGSLDIRTFKFWMVLVILILMYTSVNTFAMISGYLYAEKVNIKYKNIIKLIAITLFYSIVITGIFYAFNLFDVRSYNVINIIKSIFPVLENNYWYVMCYTLVFVLIPYINKFISSISKKDFEKLLMLLFILFSVLPNLLETIDFFRLQSGYTPFWLLYLYLIGAYIRLYKKESVAKKNIYAIKIVVCVAAAFILNYCIRIFDIKIFATSVKSSWFINYISPFIILISYYLVLLFKDLNFNNKLLKKVILILSSSSFAVYIIHCHPLIFHKIITNAFVFLSNYPTIILLLAVIFYMVIIYFGCTIVDNIRSFLFRITKFDKFFDKIGDIIDEKMHLEENE